MQQSLYRMCTWYRWTGPNSDLPDRQITTGRFTTLNLFGWLLLFCPFKAPKQPTDPGISKGDRL
jgi:hypothetical protein